MKTSVFFYVLIALAMLGVVGLVILLSPGAQPETPEVHLSVPPVQTGESSGGMEGMGRIIAIDTATVQTAIASLHRSEEYQRTLMVQRFWDGGSATQEIDVWVHGDAQRIQIRDGDGSEETILLLRGEKWLWFDDPTSAWHGPVRDGDSDAYQTLPHYEDVLYLDAENILDAGYTSYLDENCFYIRYIGGTLGYDHRCYISDESGLLLGTEIYDQDTLIYQMRSTQPVYAPPDPAVFAPP